MEAGTPRPEKSEIVHVLFIDMVGFARLTGKEQSSRMQELQSVVRSTTEFRRAESAAELLRLPTGDGMALVFFHDPAGPIQCALEIAQSLRDHPEIKLRMGVHSGPISRLIDINDQQNVAGSGINVAQRVMDCGDAGHILVSGTAADIARQLGVWGDYLHDLGECEVKHGLRIRLFNLYTNESGNPDRPLKLKPVGPGFKIPPGGALPLGSPFYIVRQTDGQFQAALERRDSIVLVKGARQAGKTSLLARGLDLARQSGSRVVLTDLQKLNSAQLQSPDTFYAAIARTIADQLNIPVRWSEAWDPDRGANNNFERFMRREVLANIREPLIWGLDEVDRLFTCDFGSEVFGLFRSWHNERSLDPQGPWRNLSLAIAYATEAYLFITDLNQSPFNVGTRLLLEDFNLEHVEELNRRHGSPLSDSAAVRKFFGLVGGNPYLVQCGLDEMFARKMSADDLESEIEREGSLFEDHLRRVNAVLDKDANLKKVVLGMTRGKTIIDADSFHRLRSAGILVGDTADEARFRCRVYEMYFSRRLVQT